MPRPKKDAQTPSNQQQDVSSADSQVTPEVTPEEPSLEKQKEVKQEPSEEVFEIFYSPVDALFGVQKKVQEGYQIVTNPSDRYPYCTHIQSIVYFKRNK